jgi:hypothetical protein
MTRMGRIFDIHRYREWPTRAESGTAVLGDRVRIAEGRRNPHTWRHDNGSPMALKLL